jgi:hypothetical protein
VLRKRCKRRGEEGRMKVKEKKNCKGTGKDQKRHHTRTERKNENTHHHTHAKKKKESMHHYTHIHSNTDTSLCFMPCRHCRCLELCGPVTLLQRCSKSSYKEGSKREVVRTECSRTALLIILKVREEKEQEGGKLKGGNEESIGVWEGKAKRIEGKRKGRR